MPGIVRKLLIFAAIDGLVLQPMVQRGQRSAPPVKIAYNGGAIGPLLTDIPGQEKGFEAFGVVGLLTVSSSSYLISITRRQLVAHIHGKPVFVITEVALTPLTSRKEAETAVEHTQAGLQKSAATKNSIRENATDEDEGEGSTAPSDDVEDDDAPPVDLNKLSIDSTTRNIGHNRKSSIAENVIAKKGGYGRFAQKWFSGNGWTANQRRILGMSAAEGETMNDALMGDAGDIDTPEAKLPTSAITVAKEEETPLAKGQDVAVALLPKLLRTAQLLFGSSRSFYFSYDHDITRSLATSAQNHALEVPLHKEVDPLFFWNHNIIQPFIDVGQYSYVLPVMQGFVGQRSFTVDKYPASPDFGKSVSSTVLEMKDMVPEREQKSPQISIGSYSNTQMNGSPDQTTDQNTGSSLEQVEHASHAMASNESQSFLLTLISRRSVKRAGLRYLRRGVDDEGNTANGVETEQMLSSTDWSSNNKIYSFLQIRGSIPLFFSQSPYSFKPVPQLQKSSEINFRAIKKHFSNLSARYGSIQVASLVEKHGVEAQLGEEYENHLKYLNESGGVDGAKVGFEWFDFHAICRGMRFENVSVLLDILGSTLDSFGQTVQQESKTVERQRGVLRTNCMDCLDRTNVVQSACGRRALEMQLKDEGFDLSTQVDQITEWFNTLWADNGDAISKQYASTAALKGDFTRTRKRNYRGAITDMGLSISRFYNGIVNDYFSQAAIDFILGNVTSLVFEEFESKMMSEDPAISMGKIRQQAIEVSQRLVIADRNEELIGGWALLTPHEPNTIKSIPFEESVILLTEAALYACRLDLNMEKVSSFERVDLQHVVKIQYGTYIISTLSAAEADEMRNVGFVVTYKTGVNNITRVNTRSLSTLPSRETSNLSHGESAAPLSLTGFLIGKPTNDLQVLSFKVLPAKSAIVEKQTVQLLSEIQQVRHICAEIERMLQQNAGLDKKEIIESADIISLAEARRSTGLMDQLGHSLKKLVWA